MIKYRNCIDQLARHLTSQWSIFAAGVAYSTIYGYSNQGMSSPAERLPLAIQLTNGAKLYSNYMAWLVMAAQLFFL